MRRTIDHLIWAALPVVLLFGFLNAVDAADANPGTADPDSSSAHLDSYKHILITLAGYFDHKGFEITHLLEDDRFEIYEDIDSRFRKAAEVKSIDLDEYKRILKFSDKERKTIEFVRRHADELKKAEETYNISRYVISAIIGIESNFGENLGVYNPFNIYVSMYAVGYRQKFARAQLRELLAFARKNNLDVFSLKSSYAGAISYAQFIPYSLNKWFVGDDIHDINNNILSVANYLSYFMNRTGSIEIAVLRYNPSTMYVKAVMELAENTRNHFAGS